MVDNPSGAVRPGDIRITDSGAVEMYDGEEWVPYRRIPNVDPGPLLRGPASEPGHGEPK